MYQRHNINIRAKCIAISTSATQTKTKCRRNTQYSENPTDIHQIRFTFVTTHPTHYFVLLVVDRGLYLLIKKPLRTTTRTKYIDKKLKVFFRPNVSQVQQERHKRRPNAGETLSIARTRRTNTTSDSKDRETQE